MIWLAWRRHRTMLLIATGLVVALMAWMALAVHWYDTAPVIRVVAGGRSGYSYRNLTGGYRLFQLSYQIEAIRLLLLMVPCLLGVLLGVPLVAGELADHTNRLAWTQGISRTRWLATKWLMLGVPLVALTGVLLAFSDWWTTRISGVTFGSVVGLIDSGLGAFGNSHIQPVTYSVTGVVPIAYTVFALALGCAFGALIRRIPWAVVFTVLVYGLALFTMVTTVRPVLAPQTFVSLTATNGFSAVLERGTPPWDIGFEARFVPGYVPAGGSPSAATIIARCENLPVGYANCLTLHHVQFGEVFQLASHYWVLQWREAVIYLIAALLLLVVSWWAVRRWRA
jgi:hypothetical protein